MKKNDITLRNLIESANELLKNIFIDYDTPAGFRTQRLIEICNQIVPIVREDYPEISDTLINATRNIINRRPIPLSPYGQMGVVDCINAYVFGDIRTTIKFLSILYPAKTGNEYKIFISYSSKDEIIVNSFVEKILLLGCGFKKSNIFCTLDHTVIRTGDDFRNEIIKNMKGCDYILCMISENYKQSEVCQNEMGAAWAMDKKRVLPFKFSNLKFTDLGFLNIVKQVADIADKSKLDELYEELCKFYHLQQDWKTYNIQKDEFVNLVNKYNS